MDELERRYLLRVLETVEGNKSRAAQLLGLDRRTLYRKLDRYRAAAKGATPSESAGDRSSAAPEPVYASA